MKYILSGAAAALSLFSAAFAQSFTPKDLDHFVAALGALDELGERYDTDIEYSVPGNDVGMAMGGPATAPAIPVKPEGGFAVFSTMADAIPAGPMRRDLMSVLKANGFASVERFGEVGDAIMSAYVALELSKADLSEMNMSEADLAQLPPQYRAMLEAQLDQLRVLIDAAKDVPAEDIALIRANEEKLDAAFE